MSQGTNCGDPNIGRNTPSNNVSVRTLNLKREIVSLDQEILMLQNSLKQALLKRDSVNA
jgi:hypothetical protein